ncbi:MAG: signal peptidase I [Pseudomonadota bacterium]
MGFKLEVFLVIASALTGLIVVWNRVFRKLAAEPAGNLSPTDHVVEVSRSFFPVLLLVLVIRSFIFEPYKIPSGSMIPTLLVGDFIFVSKFSYGIRLPVVHTKIIETGSPKRGDVVVFRLPRDPKINYIKRLIGLPGDRVQYQDGELRINGELIRLEKGERFSGFRANGDPYSGVLYEEFFDGQPHTILHQPDRWSTDFAKIIPEGMYFMMGDNREDSKDSRFREVGLVPEANLVGRAGRIWLSIGSEHEDADWSRIGKKIQ